MKKFVCRRPASSEGSELFRPYIDGKINGCSTLKGDDMRLFILSLLLCGSVVAQTSIPVPASFVSLLDAAIQKDSLQYVKSGYTQIDIDHPTAFDVNAQVPVVTQNIGDFDGDGSEDLFLCWQMICKHSYLNGAFVSAQTDFAMFGVYSLKKDSYLIQEAGKATRVETGDFDGDSSIEFIVGKKIYQPSSMSKKKVR